MPPSEAPPERRRHDDHLADGTTLEYSIRTEDPAVYHLFRADLGRRLRSAQVQIPASGAGRRFARYRGLAPGTGPSTDTYDLPNGEVTVSIDAADPGSHGYLRYHVEAAVAYTRALDVDAGRASALAVLALGVAAVVSWVAGPLPAAPAVGAGLALAVPAIVNRLAARGRAISLSRWDVPTRR